MNASSSPLIMGLLFVLRCLIPLGILFGISYLLRRWELVTENAEDDEEAELSEEVESPADEKDATHSAPLKKKAGAKKKPAASKKKKEA